jgi:peptidoglycan/LPS O-acetylase OafA/YrhL
MMKSPLFEFWFVRFARICILALVVLGVYEYLTADGQPDVLSVVFWSLAAAVASATLSTYFVRQRARGARDEQSSDSADQ